MGTEVLRPQDVLSGRLGVSMARFDRRRSTVTSESQKENSNRKVSPKKEMKAASAVKGANGNRKKVDARRKKEAAVTVKRGEPVMGKVTLLKRGESLDSLTSKIKGGVIASPADDLVISVKDVIDRALPEILPNQICLDGYAGSAFFSSPSPRSLPLPSFFKKHQIGSKSKKSFDDSASRDLRRLLRLD